MLCASTVLCPCCLWCSLGWLCVSAEVAARQKSATPLWIGLAPEPDVFFRVCLYFLMSRLVWPQSQVVFWGSSSSVHVAVWKITL